MFSNAVISGWKPTPSSRKGVTFLRICTSPEDGYRIPAIIFKRVLLPLPFSPMIPKNSPSSTSKLMSFKASNTSYDSGLNTPVSASNSVVRFSCGIRNDFSSFSTSITGIQISSANRGSILLNIKYPANRKTIAATAMNIRSSVCMGEE